MKSSRIQMGMKTVVEVVDRCSRKDLEEIFNYFDHIDQVFSPFKVDSEVARYGRGEVKGSALSSELREVLKLARATKAESGGYFDVYHNGKFDPSGIVKGWAIHHAALLLKKKGFKNFYVEAGGDIEVGGKNSNGVDWRIGLRHPFEKDKLTHILSVTNAGIATSGTYLLGQHIYDPHQASLVTDMVSLTVVGPDIYEADWIATAAFAMGEGGIQWIEGKKDLEALAINNDGTVTVTGGFKRYLIH